MSKQSSPIQEVVMKQISSGRVQMHSRLYYTLMTVAMVGAGVTGGILLAYLVDIATYLIRIQVSATPAYGARSNLADSLASFPWWVLLLAVACITLAVWLMRRYGRAYRHTRAIVVIFLIVTLSLGVGLSYTDFGGHGSEQPMRGRGMQNLR